MASLVVSSFPNAKALPLWAGDEVGLFARFSLELSIDLTPGSDVQRAKLLDGRIDIAQAAIDNALQLIVEGHDVVIVMGGESGMNEFIAQADVSSFADLRGRTLVVDAPNTGYALQARELLSRAGLTAGVDYQISSVGAAGTRFRAMLDDKTNAGAVMNPPFSSQARLRGLKSLGRMTDLLGPYQAGGAFLTRDWANKHAATLENYIKAYVSCVRWTLDPANRAKAVDILARELKLTSEVADAAYVQLVEPGFGFQRDAELDMAGIDNMLATRARTEGPNVKLDDRANYIDESWYRRALAQLPVE